MSGILVIVIVVRNSAFEEQDDFEGASCGRDRLVCVLVNSTALVLSVT